MNKIHLTIRATLASVMVVLIYRETGPVTAAFAGLTFIYTEANNIAFHNVEKVIGNLVDALCKIGKIK